MGTPDDPGAPGAPAATPSRVAAPASARGRDAGDLVFAAVALVALMCVSLLRRPPLPGEDGAPLRSGWDAHGIRPAVIDVNRASADELAALPGVGPVLARRISEGRRAERYRRLDDLGRVHGVGPSIRGRVAPYVVFLDGDP
jgi:hypothetical protein